MMLYHGGAASSLAAMKKRGILPRAESRTSSNWTHTVNSNRSAVYLTDAYAWHFAVNATDAGEKGLILEIDRDKLLPWLLCPDEDAIEQATRDQGPTKEQPHFARTDWPMPQRTMHYRRKAKELSHLVDASLAVLGTAGYYGTIPWSAVTRYVVIDWQKLHILTKVHAVDSQVSVINYRILAKRHRAFTRWFFGDETTPEEVAGWTRMAGAELMNEHLDRFAAAMANREGLDVHDAREVEATHG